MLRIIILALWIYCLVNGIQRLRSNRRNSGIVLISIFLLFALVKAIVPRYRYDQLMRLGWKIFLPLSLTWVVITASYLFYFNLLPVNN